MARAVGIGRLYAWALGAGGEAAAVNTLEILEGEIRNAIGLIGVSRLDELNPRYVIEAPAGRLNPPVSLALQIANQLSCAARRWLYRFGFGKRQCRNR